MLPPLFPSLQVRRCVGEALLQEAEDLHNELLLLLDIWRDYRAETDAKAAGKFASFDSFDSFGKPSAITNNCH